MKKTAKILLLLLLPVWSLTIAQDLSGIPGVFADIGFGARPVGMGGAYVGLASDVHSVIWNPAGLAEQKTKQAAFTYTNQLDIVDYHYFAVSYPLNNDKALGVAIISAGDEALREWTLQAAYARKIWGFSLGVALKLRYASFGNNTLSPDDLIIFEPDEIEEGISNQVYGEAPGFGFDIGFLYDVTDKMKLGVMLRDIYSPVMWDSKTNNELKPAKGSYTETVPFEAIIGASFRAIPQLVFAGDFSPALYPDANGKFSAGMEAKLFNVLMLRAGTQYYINNEDDEKFVIGTGLDMRVIKDLGVLIDFAYTFEEIDNSLRFSLGIEF